MSTTFTKAVQLANSTARINFGSDATLDDGAGWTYILGMRIATGLAGQVTLGKTSDVFGNVGWAVTPGDNGSGGILADTFVGRATSASRYRANPLEALDAWIWFAVTLNRSSFALKMYAGPYGGTVTDTGATDVAGGSGAVAADAAYSLILGENGNQTANRPVDIFCFARADSVLDATAINALLADMDAANGAAAFSLYCHPTASDTSALPDLSTNANDGTYAGTINVIDGPDSASPSTSFNPLVGLTHNRFVRS